MSVLLEPASSMHKPVMVNNVQAMQETVVGDPDPAHQLNESRLPPLYTAALFRNRQELDFLLEHGAVADIFACAHLGKAADAEILLRQYPELVRATTRDGMTALHFASRAGHIDVVDILLRYHADVNARDSRGGTALMEACHGGPWKSGPAEDVIQLLLDHDAQIDLFMAAATGRTGLIEDILDRDTGLLDIQDNQGKTALFHAAHNNRFAAVKLLIERGADSNRSDVGKLIASRFLSPGKFSTAPGLGAFDQRFFVQ